MYFKSNYIFLACVFMTKSLCDIAFLHKASVSSSITQGKHRVILLLFWRENLHIVFIENMINRDSSLSH